MCKCQSICRNPSSIFPDISRFKASNSANKEGIELFCWVIKLSHCHSWPDSAADGKLSSCSFVPLPASLASIPTTSSVVERTRKILESKPKLDVRIHIRASAAAAAENATRRSGNGYIGEEWIGYWTQCAVIHIAAASSASFCRREFKCRVSVSSSRVFWII